MGTWVWIILCVGSFGIGYGLCELRHRGREKEIFCKAMSWALNEGLLTVNADKLNEAEAEATEETTPPTDDTNTIRNPEQDPGASPASDIPSP